MWTWFQGGSLGPLRQSHQKLGPPEAMGNCSLRSPACQGGRPPSLALARPSPTSAAGPISSARAHRALRPPAALLSCQHFLSAAQWTFQHLGRVCGMRRSGQAQPGLPPSSTESLPPRSWLAPPPEFLSLLQKAGARQALQDWGQALKGARVKMCLAPNLGTQRETHPQGLTPEPITTGASKWMQPGLELCPWQAPASLGLCLYSVK